MCSAGMRQLKLMHVVHNDVMDGMQRLLVSTTPDRRASSLGQLVVRDGHVVAVDCVADGGCPPPSVVLQLGGRDITDLFTTSVDRSLSGERRSMRRVHSSVVKRHRPVAGLRATTAYDGLTLRCLATVPRLGMSNPGETLSVGLRLTVLCKHTSVLSGIHTARRTAQQSSCCLRSIGAARRCTAPYGAARHRAAPHGAESSCL